MIHGLIAWFAVISAFPNLTVNWVDNTGVHISADGREELLDRCIESGIEVRYRFLMRYCRKRVGWFDACDDERMEIHSLTRDPVSENYVVIVDRFSDDKRPEKSTFNELADARIAVSSIERMPLDFISENASELVQPGRYLGVKVIADCKRDFSDVVLDLPYLLTFGLMKTNRYDSGWIAYEMGG